MVEIQVVNAQKKKWSLKLYGLTKIKNYYFSLYY